MKKLYPLLSVLFLIYWGCEEEQEEDTTPPTVSISSHSSGQSVNEITIIVVTTNDEVGVEKVEFYIDETLVFTDMKSPYKYEWNTTGYPDSSEHSVKVISFDDSGNFTESESIILIVNNSESHPTSPDLYPINYDNGNLTVSWSVNNDNDFSSYKLYESLSEQMDNATIVFSTTDVSVNNTIISIDLNQTKYYQLVVTDTLGLQSSSNIQFGSSYKMFIRTFGGVENEYCNIGEESSDGGFILLGETTSFGNGGRDIWLVKTDQNGNEEWNNTFGGSETDTPPQDGKLETSDGGFILSGYTRSFGNGNSDMWLVKTDQNGNEEWNKTFGDSLFDGSNSVQQTNDGGYIILGLTQLTNNETDVWLIKTDQNGSEEWNKTFSDFGYGQGHSVQQTSDGGYIITGYISSSLFLIKTDPQGNEEWFRTYGGEEKSEGYSVKQTQDGGFVITGITRPSLNIRSVWLIKTDQSGNEEWNKTFGGSGWDQGRSVRQTSDGGYIITGHTGSFGNGGSDFLLIKTDPYGNTVPFGE